MYVEAAMTKIISLLSLSIYLFQVHIAFHTSYFQCADDMLIIDGKQFVEHVGGLIGNGIEGVCSLPYCASRNR